MSVTKWAKWSWARIGDILTAKELMLLIYAGIMGGGGVIAGLVTFMLTPATPLALFGVFVVGSFIMLPVARWLLPKVVHSHSATVQLRGVAAAAASGQLSAATNTVPIHEAIAHIRGSIGDTDFQKCWPVARNALRQRAHDGALHIRGRREIAGPYSGQTTFAAVYSDIPREYWSNSCISATATASDPQYFSGSHTNPEAAAAWHPTDYRLALNHYADLRVNMEEVRRLWPS